MKPAPFTYLAARTPDEVVAALADGDTRVLAGGQSLILRMNLRIDRPARLVDINRVAEFATMDVSGGTLRIRPLVRHADFVRPVDTGALGRLLALVAPYVGTPPIRVRGTMIGSLATAHPAAEWPAVVMALGGQLDLVGPGGTRTVDAADFFVAPFTTSLRAEELVAEVRLPLLPAGTGVGFVEHRRTEASFAEVAAVAALTIRDGVVDAVRLGLVNAAARPLRAHAAEQALLGQPATSTAVAQAGAVAGDVDAQPRPQPYADVAYQRHAVSVLVRRALDAALRDIPDTTAGR